MCLKKSAPEATSSEATKQEHQKHIIRSYFTRSVRALTLYSVRIVQPLTLRMPLQPPSLHLVSTSRQE